MCVHTIDLMSIHFLCCAQVYERSETHDAVCDIFATIAQNVGIHMWQEQLHKLPLPTFNSFCQRINLVFTKNGIHTLVDVVIADSMHVDLFPWSCIT